MALGISHPGPDKFPGAIVNDLRDYAAALGLPADWHKRVTTRCDEGGFRTRWMIDYEAKPLATYDLDVLKEIESVQHHVPIPPPVDPLVVATQLAMSQPADPQWRRFKYLTFRRDEVISVNNVDEKGRENEGTFVIMFRNGQQLICGNEKNYANSGVSTCEFFLQHVMGLSPPQHADRTDSR